MHRRTWQEGDLTVSDQCRQCGKDIAMQLDEEALCCRCRYGETSAHGYVNHAAELDMVEWLSGHVGYRLSSGMIRFAIENW